MKKLFFLISLLVLTAILLVGCGGGEATEADCGNDDVLCVGLMTDVGEVDDYGTEITDTKPEEWDEPLQEIKPPGVED